MATKAEKINPMKPVDGQFEVNEESATHLTPCLNGSCGADGVFYFGEFRGITRRCDTCNLRYVGGIPSELLPQEPH